jgi:tetratricopeptide (TPR) repeat protein
MTMRRLSLLIWRTAVAALPVIFLAATVGAHEGLHEQIAELTRQLKREPKNAQLYLKRGELYRLHRDWKAALADYGRADSLDSRLDETKWGRGRMYYEANKPRQAKIWLDRFLTTRPDHVDALMTRGRVLVALKDRLTAVKDYSRAISQLARPKPEYYTERAQALVAEGRTEEALGGMDEGIKTLGSIVTLQLFAIDLELSSRRYEAALARLARLAAQSPRKESWLARRGEILLLAGRKWEAREAFQSALAAIESLPQHLRGTRATSDLESRVRKALVSE